MKRSAAIRMMVSIFAACLLAAAAGAVFAGDYDILKGVKSARAVFDFEHGDPNGALGRLQVIHDTYRDKNLLIGGRRPEVAVVFIGPSVRLVSRNRDRFRAEDRKVLENLEKKVSEMAGDGVRFEICLIALRRGGVDPDSVFPEIRRVGNGWISLIGYQAKGYSLIPLGP